MEEIARIQKELATQTLRGYWGAMSSLGTQLDSTALNLQHLLPQSLEYAGSVALCALVVDQAVTQLRLAVELGRQELADGSTLTESFATLSSPYTRQQRSNADDELPF